MIAEPIAIAAAYIGNGCAHVDALPIDEAVAPIDLDLPRLVSEYSGLLYRYAFRLSGNQVDAEDLTQQTFLIAHQKLHQIRDAAAASGWLLAVMRHAYLRGERRNRVEKISSSSFNVESLADGAAPEPDLDREELQNAINSLPDPYKLVVLSYYFEQLSYREIAERFDLPVGTVMSRLSRAKDQLRSRLLSGKGPSSK